MLDQAAVRQIHQPNRAFITSLIATPIILQVQHAASCREQPKANYTLYENIGAIEQIPLLASHDNH